MGVLREMESRFRELRGSPALDSAFGEWKQRRVELARFEGPNDLIAFMRKAMGSYQERDQMAWALCLETFAGSDRETRSQEAAFTLLVGIFLPALWGAGERVLASADIEVDELQASLLDGFIEAAARKRTDATRVSGDLINGARHRAWEMARQSFTPTSDLEEALHLAYEDDPIDPVWKDPWVLLCYARMKEVVTDDGAELIFWTRLNGELLSKVALLLGLSPDQAYKTRSRAQTQVEEWIRSERDEYPPRDAATIRRLLRVTTELGRVTAVLRPELSKNTP